MENNSTDKAAMESNNSVASLRAVLEGDAKSPAPRYPAQALLALRSQTCVAAIEKRIAGGQTVIDVRPLPYYGPAGLLFVVFDFGPPAMLGQGKSAILTILTGDAKVVGIVDPFDTDRPNPAMASLPPAEIVGSPLPFALSRPSATETVRFSREQMGPTEARTRSFFQDLGRGLGGGGLGGGVFGTDGTSRTQISTQTVWHHGGWTPGPFSWIEYDEKIDDITDDYIA